MAEGITERDDTSGTNRPRIAGKRLVEIISKECGDFIKCDDVTPQVIAKAIKAKNRELGTMETKDFFGDKDPKIPSHYKKAQSMHFFLNVATPIYPTEKIVRRIFREFKN